MTATRMFEPADWMEHGNCRNVTAADLAATGAATAADMFHPTRGTAVAVAICKTYCATCPVVAQCLDMALDDSTLSGVWGNTSGRDRRTMRRRRRGLRPGQRADAAQCGTVGGHSAHKRRGEAPCRPCTDARNAYSNAYAAQRRAS